MENGGASPLGSYITALTLADGPALLGISAICAKLLVRGIFDRDDINELFDVMVKSVPDIQGEASFMPGDQRAALERHREIILQSVRSEQ